MDIEKLYGERVVLRHIFPKEFIEKGQRWQGSSGGVVEVYAVVDDLIFYQWIECGEKATNQKDSFSFQCRYSFIVEDERDEMKLVNN